ncbi:MAG: hypothetical protein QW706_06715 [Candidatus Nezhaarchaeales archaeon]
MTRKRKRIVIDDNLILLPPKDRRLIPDLVFSFTMCCQVGLLANHVYVRKG